jgi:hypothetical protein
LVGADDIQFVDWRATCNNIVVRIPSATISSNTAMPLPQSGAHVGTFQSVLEGASHQRAPVNASVDIQAKPESQAKPEAVGNALRDNASEQGAAQAASGTSTEHSADRVVWPNGEHCQATPTESVIPPVATVISTSDIPLPSTTQANPYRDTLIMLPAFPAIEGTAEPKVISPDATSTAEARAPIRPGAKLDKQRASSDGAAAVQLAGVLVAVVEQSIAPVQQVLSGSGNLRGQAERSLGPSAKTSAAGSSDPGHTTAADPVAGAVVKDANAQIAPQETQVSDTSLHGLGPVENLLATAPIPLASLPPSNIEAGLPLGKATLKGAFDTVGSKPSDSTISLNTGKNAASGSSNIPIGSIQSDGQTSQSMNADPARSVSMTARVPDTGAVQVQGQAVAMHLASQGPVVTQHVPASTGDAVVTNRPSELPAPIHTGSSEPVASSGINAARLIQSMGQSEMRVGMHSAEFGDISIRTTISQQQMVTQISLSHNDLSQAISAHVATAQAKLGEDYGLHASIEINNQGSLPSGDAQNSSPQEQRSFSSSNRAKTATVSTVTDSGMDLGAMTSTGNRYGLDIRI